MLKKRFVCRNEIEILKNSQKKFNYISDSSTPLDRIKLIHIVIAKFLETGEQIAVINSSKEKDKFRVLSGKLLEKIFFDEHLKLNKHAIHYFNNRIYYKGLNRLVCIVPDRVAIKDKIINLTLEKILETELTRFAYCPSLLGVENYVECTFKNINYLHIDALLDNSYNKLFDQQNEENLFLKQTPYSLSNIESNIGMAELVKWFEIKPLISKDLLENEIIDASMSEYSEKSEVYSDLEKKSVYCGSAQMFKNREMLDLKPCIGKHFNLLAHALRIEKIIDENHPFTVPSIPKERISRIESRNNLSGLNKSKIFTDNNKIDSEENVEMEPDDRKSIESKFMLVDEPILSKKAPENFDFYKKRSKKRNLDEISDKQQNSNDIDENSNGRDDDDNNECNGNISNGNSSNRRHNQETDIRSVPMKKKIRLNGKIDKKAVNIKNSNIAEDTLNRNISTDNREAIRKSTEDVPMALSLPNNLNHGIVNNRFTQFYSTILQNSPSEYVDCDFLLNNFSCIETIEGSESLKKIFYKIIIPYHSIMSRMYNSAEFKNERAKNDILIANEMSSIFDLDDMDT